MHATAISCVFLAVMGQVGTDYGGKYADSEYGPPMSATSSPTRTRSTRATNPLKESYPPSRVATQPRYAAESSRESTLPPVGDSTRVAQEDPQSSLASKLLRDLLQSPVRGDENLRTLRLYDALEKATGSQQQFNAIKAYWEWSLAVSELHGVYEEDSILHDRKNTPRATHEQAAHVANQRASRSRLEDSRLDVAAKVVDLLETTGNRGASSAILPADVPFVSTYNTNFSRIFPGNSAPVTLAKIHKTLPSALSVVRARATSCEASRQALFSAQDAFQRQQCAYDDFVNALALVRSQRRAFLDSVHDYNFAIAEYALSIAGPGMRRETVVSMLIRTSPAPYRGASLDYSGDVVPASATQEFSSSAYDTYLVSPEKSAPSFSDFPADLGNQPVRRQMPGVYVR